MFGPGHEYEDHAASDAGRGGGGGSGAPGKRTLTAALAPSSRVEVPLPPGSEPAPAAGAPLDDPFALHLLGGEPKLGSTTIEPIKFSRKLSYLEMSGALSITPRAATSPEARERVRNELFAAKASGTESIGEGFSVALSAALMKSTLEVGTWEAMGVKFEFEQTLLDAKLKGNEDGSTKTEVTLVSLAFKGSGKVPMTQVAPSVGGDDAGLFDAKITVKGEIKLDGADAVRFVEMHRKTNLLRQQAKELDGLAKQARKLAGEIDETRARLAKLRKGGDPATIKQLRAKLARSEKAQRALGKKIGAHKQLMETTTKAIVGLDAEKMKSPIGKIAGKAFLQTAGKAVAKLLPFVGVVLSVVDITMAVIQLLRGIDGLTIGLGGGDGGGDTEGGEGGEGEGEGGTGEGGTGGGGDTTDDGEPIVHSTEGGFECVEGVEVQRPAGLPTPAGEFPSCDVGEPNVEEGEALAVRPVTRYLLGQLAALGVKAPFDADAIANLDAVLPAGATAADIDALAARIAAGEEPAPKGDAYDVIAALAHGVTRAHRAEPATLPPPAPSTAPGGGASGGGASPDPSAAPGSMHADPDRPGRDVLAAFGSADWSKLLRPRTAKHGVAFDEEQLGRLRTHWEKDFITMPGSALSSRLRAISMDATANPGGKTFLVTITVEADVRDADGTISSRTETHTVLYDPHADEAFRWRPADTDALVSTQFLKLSHGRLRWTGAHGTVTLLGETYEVQGASDHVDRDRVHHVKFKLQRGDGELHRMRDAAGTLHATTHGEVILRFVVLVEDDVVRNRFA